MFKRKLKTLDYMRFESNQSLRFNFQALLGELQGEPIPTILLFMIILGLVVWSYLSTGIPSLYLAATTFVALLFLGAAVKSHLMFSGYGNRHGRDYPGSFFVISFMIVGLGYMPIPVFLIAAITYEGPGSVSDLWGTLGVFFLIFYSATFISFSGFVHRKLVQRNL